MFTGEMITADQAQKIGMINSVVPDAELMQRAMSLAERLAAAPTAAIAQIKKLLEASANNDCRSQLELEREAQLKQGKTKDFIEGISSFLEKRPPRFIGS
jgi:2-(1,2-epoxy-1,2-dihydrophenyl)acetyl-CoA isomerase